MRPEATETEAAGSGVPGSTDLRTLLAGAIRELPEREREILALYYEEELTMAEIGKVIDGLAREARTADARYQALAQNFATLKKQMEEIRKQLSSNSNQAQPPPPPGAGDGQMMPTTPARAARAGAASSTSPGGAAAGEQCWWCPTGWGGSTSSCRETIRGSPRLGVT